MKNQSFKVLVHLPSKLLYDELNQLAAGHKLDLLQLPTLSALPQYVKRAKPAVVLATLNSDESLLKQDLETLIDIRRNSQIWLVLLTEKSLDDVLGNNALPTDRIFIQRYTRNPRELLSNLMSIRATETALAQQSNRSKFEEHLSYCTRMVTRQHDVAHLFERLVNYYPKVIPMNYWALFAFDPKFTAINQFTSFAPPNKPGAATQMQQIERLAERWLRVGQATYATITEEPELFAKLREWGWPVQQIYFMPSRYKDRAIAGVIVGHDTPYQMSPDEIRFLNEMNGLIAERILEQSVAGADDSRVQGFADRLLTNQFNEEVIFDVACQELQAVSGSSSTVFWQFNKGFGFLFPKYSAFGSEGKPSGFSERNMIFLDKDAFLSQLISENTTHTIDHIYDDVRLGTSTRTVFRKLLYNNVLILPLAIHEEVIGALILNKQQPGDRFSVVEIHSAEEIVKKTQSVLEGANTIKDANFKLKQLARIFELGREMKLDLELDAIIARITMNLRKTLGWNDVAFLIEDELGQRLRANSASEDNSEATRKIIDLTKEVTLDQFRRLLGTCERISSSYFSNTRRLGQSTNGDSKDVTEWQEDDLLIIPLETRNKVLGYMVVQDPVDRLKPNIEKIIPLEYYANQAAVAVENAILYEQLRSSQERYRSLAETMSLALVTCDKHGEIVYGNPAFNQLLSADESELTSKPFADFLTDKSRGRFEPVVADLLSEDSGEGSSSGALEFDILNKNDEKIPVSVLGFPFYERRNKTGFFLILTDLRVIKRLERMKADFNSMIVHDLRSPMNVIQGFLELIRNRVVGDINTEQEELLDIAKENVNKVLTLVDNFLVASKLDVGRFTIDPKLDEINVLIEKQVDNHRVLVKNKNVDIGVELDPNLPLLFFDSLRIEQVLNNLLSNALKFTPENGNIWVRSRLVRETKDDEERFLAQISVKDNGMGIPADKIDHVFEKYEQVDESRAFNVRGTGLGLSICKEIVNLHGGEIWVESDLQSGSEFTFTLPIEAQLEKVVN